MDQLITIVQYIFKTLLDKLLILKCSALVLLVFKELIHKVALKYKERPILKSLTLSYKIVIVALFDHEKALVKLGGSH